MHSSSVGQGCSRRSRSKPPRRRAATIASCRRHAPLASPIRASSGPVTAWTAATRAAVVFRRRAELELEVVDPAGAFALDEGRHLRRAAERHRHVQRHVRLERATEQRGDGLPGRPAQDVPAGDIDRALRVFVTAQGRVHPVGDGREVRGVHADECRRQLAQRGPRSFGERRQVGAPERTRLAEPLEPATRPDPDDRARQHVDDPSGRHDVVAVRVGQVVAVDVDPVDDGRAVAHRACLLRGVRWCTHADHRTFDTFGRHTDPVRDRHTDGRTRAPNPEEPHVPPNSRQS